MSDLKSARTLMKVEKVDPKGQGETEPKIDQYISSVEAYAITEAGKLFPGEKVDKWLTALDLASCDSCVTIEEPKEEMRFIPGVPTRPKMDTCRTNQRVLPIEKLEKMATENKLGFKREKDGHLIVYGTDENIKIFVKKMTAQANQPTE